MLRRRGHRRRQSTPLRQRNTPLLQHLVRRQSTPLRQRNTLLLQHLVRRLSMLLHRRRERSLARAFPRDLGENVKDPLKPEFEWVF
jgi:hypothetical protein